MRVALLSAVLLLQGALALAQSGEIQPKPMLESDEFQRMKTQYRDCVLDKGRELMSVTSFETAMQYAPLACRRGLLQIKQFMLGSAFKVEVIDGLLASVAEGVEIDLVRALLAQKLADSPEP